MEKMEHTQQGTELARFEVAKTFRLYAITAKGQEVYLGRHSVEFGRDDLKTIIAVEEKES